MENPTQLYNVNKSLTDIGQNTVNFSGGTVANGSGTVNGLNVYQIYPKKIIYPINGYNATNAVNAFIGSVTTSATFDIFNIGQNLPRNFNIYNTSASDATTRYVDIEYINASGNLDISAIEINNSATAIRLSNAININRLSWSSGKINATATNVNVSATVHARDTSMTNVIRNAVSLTSAVSSGSSVITVPNSYIGVISELYIYTATYDHIRMFVKDKKNNIKACRRMVNASMNFSGGRTHYLGAINFPLYPGESVYFGSELTTGGDRYVKAIVTLTPY